MLFWVKNNFLVSQLIRKIQNNQNVLIIWWPTAQSNLAHMLTLQYDNNRYITEPKISI